MTWHAGALLALDVETTGTDPFEDRIVTAALVEVDPAGRCEIRSWLIDPGVPIPAGAEAVHGISTEQAVRDGVAPAQALAEITTAVADWLAAGGPVVAFNASFDLTMLEAENERHGVATLGQRLGEIRPVIDPFVLDKQVDTYRKGKRTLPVLAELYGVTLDNAHSAAADAAAAALLARRIAVEFPELGDYTLDALHDAQTSWRKEQQRSLAAYFERQGNLDAARSTRHGWPTVAR